MKNIKKYLTIINRETKKFPDKFSKIHMLTYFFIWKKTLLMKDVSLNSEIPWINFPAIDFLKKIVNPQMKVYEYGAGSSTIFWAKRTKQVITVEHDSSWAKRVEEKLMNNGLINTTILCILPVKEPNFVHKKIENPDDYISDDKSFHGKNFVDYVKSINSYPENYFDIVVIDGRARPSCLLNARTKVKGGGYLVIDNTEREYYLQNTLPVLQKEKWEQYDFYGAIPYLEHFCRTTIFKKE